MEDLQETISENYEKNLDPHEFRDFKMESLKITNWQDNYDFWFSCLSQFFHSGKFRGDRLLDIGSGPTVYNVAVASFYFPNIILSDFVESNCEQLRKWLRKDADSIDWFPFLSRVAEIEKYEDVEQACKRIEEQIRKSVKDVIHCNVLNEEVIDKKYSQEPFDLILSSLTLETAAADFDAYCKCLGNIKRLLKKGGKLILMSLTQCSGWTVKGKRFHCLSLKESDIQKALELNGFCDMKWKFREQPYDGLPYHCDKAYFVSCTC